MGKFNVALPISIYALNKDMLTEWVKEIKEDWHLHWRKLSTPIV